MNPPSITCFCFQEFLETQNPPPPSKKTIHPQSLYHGPYKPASNCIMLSFSLRATHHHIIIIIIIICTLKLYFLQRFY